MNDYKILKLGMKLSVPLGDDTFCRSLVVRCSRGGGSALGVFFAERFKLVNDDSFNNLNESDVIAAFCFGKIPIATKRWHTVGIMKNYDALSWKKPLLFSRSIGANAVNVISVKDDNVLVDESWEIVDMSNVQFESVKHFHAGASGHIYIEEYLSEIL